MRIARQLLLGALALSRFAVAQDGDEQYSVHGNTNATTSSNSVKEGNITVHFVTVGKATNNFYPNSVTADIGDKIMFTFYPSKHSVIKAAYGYPCIPYNMLNPGEDMFYSGWEPVKSADDSLPVWNLTINDTQPIFYYCGAPSSCNYWGMVGGINLNASTPISNQIGLARTSEFMLIPGDKYPTEAQLASLQSEAASATTATFTVTETPEAKSSGYPQYGTPGYNGSDGDGGNYDEHHGLSTGAVAGIAVGSAVFALAAVGLLWLLLRTRSLKKRLDEQQAAQQQQQQPPDPRSPMGYGPQGAWPAHQSRQMSQLPPYQTHETDMYKPPDSEGYAVSDVPSRRMSPHQQVSPYNMQGQFIGSQHGDPRQNQNRYTTHSELSGSVGPMVELDAPSQHMPADYPGPGRYQ